MVSSCLRILFHADTFVLLQIALANESYGRLYSDDVPYERLIKVERAVLQTLARRVSTRYNLRVINTNNVPIDFRRLLPTPANTNANTELLRRALALVDDR